MSFMKKCAVKGFVVMEGKLLLIQRSDSNRYPGVWEIPGGRLEEKESIENGLKREIYEEVGLDVTVLFPLSAHHFKRNDGQEIHMVSFLCKAENQEINLSNEHKNFVWATLEESKKLLHKEYLPDLKVISDWFLKEGLITL